MHVLVLLVRVQGGEGVGAGRERARRMSISFYLTQESSYFDTLDIELYAAPETPLEMLLGLLNFFEVEDVNQEQEDQVSAMYLRVRVRRFCFLSLGRSLEDKKKRQLRVLVVCVCVCKGSRNLKSLISSHTGGGEN